MFSSLRVLSKMSRKGTVVIQRQSSLQSNQQAFFEHYCIAITTWFCCPEMGMTSYKSLMKSSAFVVKSKLAEMGGPEYHVVTSSHNVAPWRYPKYYPQPFMKMINEDHIHITAELRTSSGEMLTVGDIGPDSFHHPTKDIAILHFLHGTAALSAFKDLGFQYLDVEPHRASPGENLIFHGHEVFETANSSLQMKSPREEQEGEAGDSEVVMLSSPRSVEGSLVIRSAHQTFCSTEGIVLSPGMCGGPVVGKRGSICGMIEGIVPVDHAAEELRGSPVIIEAVDILNFVDEVEKTPENVILMKGGKISNQVVGEQSLKQPEDYRDPMAYLTKNL